jgi:hypothetical protein
VAGSTSVTRMKSFPPHVDGDLKNPGIVRLSPHKRDCGASSVASCWANRVASSWATLAVVCVLALGGCNEAPPPLSGGKPVSHWVEASRDADAKTRREAVFKLGNAGATSPSAMPAVIAALKDRDARVRQEAILAIVKFGDAAKEAAPTLEDIRKNDRDSRAREYAGKALRTLQ